MLPATRMLDTAIGICTAHPPVIHTTTGIVYSSQFTVLINGLPAARLLDTVMTPCGGVGIIVSGSSVFIGGLPAAHLTSSVVGSFTGMVIGGSSNVFL